MMMDDDDDDDDEHDDEPQYIFQGQHRYLQDILSYLSVHRLAESMNSVAGYLALFLTEKCMWGKQGRLPELGWFRCFSWASVAGRALS